MSVAWNIDVAPVLGAIDRLRLTLTPTSLERFLLLVAHPYLVERIEDRFEAKGDDVSGKWEPLAPSTMMIRILQGYSPTPTNIRSGAMFDALRQARNVRPMATGAEISMGHAAVSDTKTKQKIKVAQQGGTAPNAGRDTPARPVIGMNARDLGVMSTSFEKWLKETSGVLV